MAIQNARQNGLGGIWNGIEPPTLPLPVKDGDGVKDDGTPYGPECKGHWLISCSSKTPVGIVDQNVNPILNQTEIYPGVYVRASLNVFPYGGKDGIKKGISCGLNNIQKVKDGETFAGKSRAEEDFTPIQLTNDPISGAALPGVNTSATMGSVDPITGQPF